MKKPPTSTSEEQILGLMGEWSKHCGVKFEKTAYSEDSQIRINFEKGMVLTFTYLDRVEGTIGWESTHA